MQDVTFNGILLFVRLLTSIEESSALKNLNGNNKAVIRLNYCTTYGETANDIVEVLYRDLKQF